MRRFFLLFVLAYAITNALKPSENSNEADTAPDIFGENSSAPPAKDLVYQSRELGLSNMNEGTARFTGADNTEFLLAASVTQENPDVDNI